MNQSPTTASLISYLRPSNHFYLKLSKEGKDSGPEGTHVPFSVVSDSEPFALILEASIASSEDCGIQDAFLMIQKDEPGLPDDALWPVNNHDIDQAWRNSFSFLENHESKGSFIILKDQVDERKNPVRWLPLFYCMKRRIYLHPCCRSCGSLLDVCTDDDLLIRSTLKPYSTSLKRYLCCPHCLGAGKESEFYVSSKDLADPENVKDRKDLIKGFGEIDPNQLEDDRFPCAGCPDHDECYTSGDQALSRLVSVSFYPFYLQLHRAPTLHLIDFIPLISGASFEDLKREMKAGGQDGRWRCLKELELICSRRSLFLFDQEERFFPEVLYLKLAILSELSRIFFGSIGKLRYPDFGLSIERFWVNVAEQNPELPFFWNFSLRPVGVSFDPVKGPHAPRLPNNFALYLLGFIWFYVLLVNKRNPAPVVREKVAEAFEGMHGGVADLQSTWTDDPEGVFAPNNIFWDADDQTVPPRCESLWSTALQLGFRLLEAGGGELSRWSGEEFEKELGNLREKVKKILFMPEAVQSTRPVDTDQDIQDILLAIYDKWRLAPQKVSARAEIPPAEIRGEDEDLLDDIVRETVILTPGVFEKENFGRIKIETEIETGGPEPSEPERSLAPAETESTEKGDLPETVIVSPGSFQEDESPPPDAAEEEVPETMIISPDKVLKARTEAGTTGKDTAAEKPPQEPRPGKGDTEEDPDAVPETVIIRPGKNGKAKS